MQAIRRKSPLAGNSRSEASGHKGVHMRAMLRRLGRALPAGSAILILAACGSTSTPTGPAEGVAATKPAATATDAAAAPPTSITVRGTVVDSSNRRLANATVECPGDDVLCAGPGTQVTAEGHGHQVTTTRADGSYEIVATSRSGGATGRFLMNANGRGYQVEWRQIEWPDPACTSEEPRCALTVDFTLTSVAD